MSDQVSFGIHSFRGKVHGCGHGIAFSSILKRGYSLLLCSITDKFSGKRRRIRTYCFSWRGVDAQASQYHIMVGGIVGLPDYDV